MSNPIWTVSADTNALSVKPAKSANFDPETYSTASDEMIDGNNMWNRFQKIFGGNGQSNNTIVTQPKIFCPKFFG